MSKYFLVESSNKECVQVSDHSNLNNREFSEKEAMPDSTILYTSKTHPDIKVTLKFANKAEGDKAALDFENQLKDLVLEKIYRQSRRTALQSSDQRKAKEEP